VVVQMKTNKEIRGILNLLDGKSKRVRVQGDNRLLGGLASLVGETLESLKATLSKQCRETNPIFSYRGLANV
jgi:hypothetical protein